MLLILKEGNTVMQTHINFNSSAGFISHRLQCTRPGVTWGISSPEITTSGRVDGEEFVYSKITSKTKWKKKAKYHDEQYWNKIIKQAEGRQVDLQKDFNILEKHNNHTEGIHTLQRMYGCELGDDGNITGYDRYGYNGEDFFSLDLKTETWTAANAEAVTIKQKWEETHTAANVKAYLLNECPEQLKKYVGYGRSTLERKVPPKTDLFQKDSSSPVVCHATGFYPKPVNITWKKNGEDLHEGVELRETLPNQDGTFQRRSILTVPPEELYKHNYTCINQHSSLEKEVVLQVSDRRVLSGGGPVGTSNGAVTAVLLLLIILCVGVFTWKKNQSGVRRVSGKPSARFRRDSRKPKTPSEEDPASTSSN